MNVSNNYSSCLNDWYKPTVYLGIPIALVVGTFVVRRYFSAPPVPAPENRPPERIVTPITPPQVKESRLDKFRKALPKLEIATERSPRKAEVAIEPQNETLVKIFKREIGFIIEEIKAAEFEMPERRFNNFGHFRDTFKRIQKSNLEYMSFMFLDLHENLLKFVTTHSNNLSEIESQLREAEEFFHKYSSEIIESCESIFKSLKKYPFFFKVFNGDVSDFDKVDYPTKLVNLLDPTLSDEIQINNLDELKEMLALYTNHWDVSFSLRKKLNETLALLVEKIKAMPQTNMSTGESVMTGNL